MTAVIQRQCVGCGDEMTVVLDDDNSIIEGGVYFGDMSLPVEDTGEWVDAGTTEIAGEEFGLSDWTGEYEEMEWWECDRCYLDPDDVLED